MNPFVYDDTGNQCSGVQRPAITPENLGVRHIPEQGRIRTVKGRIQKSLALIQQARLKEDGARDRLPGPREQQRFVIRAPAHQLKIITLRITERPRHYWTSGSYPMYAMTWLLPVAFRAATVSCTMVIPHFGPSAPSPDVSNTP